MARQSGPGMRNDGKLSQFTTPSNGAEGVVRELRS